MTMYKKFLKKISGSNQIEVIGTPPVWGKIPVKYRDGDWNIDGIWYNNNTITGDILDDINPFDDNTLLAKYTLNNTLYDLVSGTTATPVGDVSFSSYKSGLFNRKAYSGREYSSMLGYIKSSNVLSLTNYACAISAFISVGRNSNFIEEDDRVVIWTLVDQDERVLQSLIATTNELYFKYLDSNATYNTLTVYTGDFIKPRHVVISYNATEIGVYIDGEWVTEEFIPVSMKIDNSKLLIGNTSNHNPVSVQQLEVYNNELPALYIRTLYNQAHLLPKRCDGYGANSPSFTYIEEDNKLVVALCDMGGHIVGLKTTDKNDAIRDDCSNANIPLTVKSDSITGSRSLSTNVATVCGSIDSVIFNTNIDYNCVVGYRYGAAANSDIVINILADNILIGEHVIRTGNTTTTNGMMSACHTVDISTLDILYDKPYKLSVTVKCVNNSIIVGNTSILFIGVNNDNTRV